MSPVCILGKDTVDTASSPVILKRNLNIGIAHLGFPGVSGSKGPPARQETWVRSLGWEGPLEKETATHSSTLAWKIPWTEEPDRLQSMGLQRVGYN